MPDPTLIPSLTPNPKLSREDALARFWALYENNDDCTLPCWWGFTPGKTSWKEVNELLNPMEVIVLDSKSGTLASYVFLFDLPPELASPISSQFTAGFIVEGDTVQAISVGSRWVNRNLDYSLAGLLIYLGQPDEIWLKLFPDPASGIPHYDMQIFFLKQGVWVWIVGDATKQNEILTICPQKRSENSLPPGLFIWNLEKANTGEEVDLFFEDFTADGLKLKNYRLLGNLQSSINTKEFYEIYIDPNATKCFSVNATFFYDP